MGDGGVLTASYDRGAGPLGSVDTTPAFQPPMGTEHHPPLSANDDQSTRRLMRMGTLGILAFWLVVMAALYFAMQYAMKPKGVTVTADGAVVIPRHHDGHFRVAGSINGVPVMFLVDTGASLVGVTAALAREAGLQGGDPITFQTANGPREGRVIASDSVTVRSLAVSGLRVGTGYTGRSDDDALLGQNFLRHFDVEMGRDRMVLRPRGG